MIEGRHIEKWGQYAPKGLPAWAIEQSCTTSKALWGSFCRRLVLSGRKEPLDVERFGARFRFYPLDNLCEKRALLSPSRFDPMERDILQERLHKTFRFVDIGANIGLYSLLVAAGAGPDAKVLAVEPQPVIKQRLAFNIAANPGLDISHVDCALSDRKGMARMGVSARNRGATGFALRSGARPDEEFVVQTRTLQELLQARDMQGADALKMDIEGAEDQVLPAYFESTPDADLPSLLILERNPAWKVDCVALAEARGYQLIQKAHMNVVLAR
jgi:FkbM family methyltransferase